MIGLKKQKLLAFIPFLNFPIIFFSMARNSSKLKPNWQLKLIVPIIISVAFIWILNLILGFAADYIGKKTVVLISLYLGTVLLSGMLIYWQKKNGVE